ncbi:MAG: ArsR/SmtB family transcription factor [bacterium]
MVEYNQSLSKVLKASSDQTRRSILSLLIQQGPCRVTDLAKHFEMSLNAVSKHIKILESAGLASRTTLGRVHLIEACLDEFQLIERWIAETKNIWALRLDALEKSLDGEKENE